MHLLTAASLKNRALIALVTIVATIFGLIGMGSLKQELMPSIEFPAIVVVTNYPGASPEVVNNDVSEPIETALRSVPNLESTTATSTTGASMVLAEFTYGVDIAATEQRVERAVSRISQMLPAQTDPQVTSGSIDDFPVIQVAVTPPADTEPEETANLIERTVLPKLDDLDGVREAQLSGARGDRVTITPDTSELSEHGLSTQSVTDALQQSGVLMAAGTITEEDGTLAVQAGSTLHSADDIAGITIPLTPEQIAASQQPDPAAQQELFGQEGVPGQPGQGQLQEPQLGAPQTEPAAPAEPQTIGDVASVEREPNPITGYSRVNGEPALTIAITKMSAANTVDVSHAVQEALTDVEASIDGASMHIIFDQAPYVEQSVHTLTTEGLLGLVFAVLVILVFLLSVRATLVTAISIPTSILLTFIGLNFADYTLNMLTLGALTISIGRVVDDSIVVIENIKRALRPGDDRVKAIVGAVREVAGAITSSTVATIVVFLPMAFVDGMVGELFRPFAFTASIALAASLLVSLTIVPVLAYWFLRPDKEHRERAETVGDDAEPARENWLRRGYRPLITWTLRRPAVTLLIALVVFGGTIAMSPLMKTNFMGSDEQNSIGLTQTLSPGLSLEAQLEEAERVESALADIDAVETVQLNIGGQGDGMAAIFGSGGDGAINYAITTDADADQTVVQDQVRDAVDELEDAGEFSLGMSDGGVTMSTAIEISVTGPDQESLAEASDAVVSALQAQDGVQQVESDLATSRPFLRVAVDRAEAAEAGLSEAAVAGMVAAQMQPETIGQVTIDATTIDVYLSQGEAPDDREGLAAMTIQTPAGEERLDALATIEVADGPVTVRTENAVRMVTVSALPVGDDLGTAGIAVDDALASADMPAGTSATIGGVMSQQEEAFTQLGLALLIAILIVYVVMVATFRSLLQPLLLLVSVPFAATGAILLLIVSGIPLGAASLIGVLMLIGIVVTNAIVLIDLVNQFRDRGDALYEAVLHGSLQRLRPIVMTALATILALTPMGLGITGKGGFISQPLAVVVIGGLFSSTLMTLIVLPTLYYIVERRREGKGKRGARRRRRNRPSSAAPARATAGAGSGVLVIDSVEGSETDSGIARHGGDIEPSTGVESGADVEAGAEPDSVLQDQSPDAHDTALIEIIRRGEEPSPPIEVPAAPEPVAATEHQAVDDPPTAGPVTGELHWDELMDHSQVVPVPADTDETSPIFTDSASPDTDPLWQALIEDHDENER